MVAWQWQQRGVSGTPATGWSSTFDDSTEAAGSCLVVEEAIVSCLVQGCHVILNAFVSSLLLSPTSLCLPHSRPINSRDEVLRQEYDFIGKLADGEDGRLTSLHVNHFNGVWMPVSFPEQRAGGEEGQV